LVNIVSVKTGEVEQHTIDLFEDMRVTCGAYLQEHVRLLSKNCLNAMNPSVFVNDKLNHTACYRSKALDYYKGVAEEIVREYENHVRLTPLADGEQQEYVVGAYQPSGEVKKPFKHAAHPHYDSKAFNGDEGEFAKALDKYEHAWVRNKDRVDYGIPLPIKSGSSSQFFPDFLWWVKKTVWALDPTGKFILDEKIRTKLLTVPIPLRIALIVRGHLDPGFKRLSEDGWSVMRFRLGNNAPENFDTLEELLTALIAES
jgi:type III restriction enzyme